MIGRGCMSIARVPGTRLLRYFVFGIITVAAFTFYVLGSEMKRGSVSVLDSVPLANKYIFAPQVIASGESLDQT